MVICDSKDPKNVHDWRADNFAWKNNEKENKSQVSNTNLNPHQIYKNHTNGKKNKTNLCNKSSWLPMNEVKNSIVDSFPQFIVHGPDVRIMICDMF